VLGAELAGLVGRRLSMFQDLGLDRLRAQFADIDHPAAWA